MRVLGRRGGKANGRVNPERVPRSLREELTKLDPVIVREAIERSLAGGNESARVSAVKLLADLDLGAFGKNCAACERAAAVDMDAIRAKLTSLLVRQSGAATDAFEREVEARVQQRLEALKAEHQPA